MAQRDSGQQKGQQALIHRGQSSWQPADVLVLSLESCCFLPAQCRSNMLMYDNNEDDDDDNNNNNNNNNDDDDDDNDDNNNSNNNNSERVSRAPFHVKHAQLR